MTLGRQLVSTISALFFVALFGVQWIHLRSAHEHLQEQLESIAQDAATSLGLSLGVLLRGGDLALAETIINPVFDRGQYELVEFVSLSGEALVRKTLPVQQGGEYPPWFAELFPLGAPTAESFVSGGWRQLGKVRVRVHPRFAYKQLWATASGTALTLIALYVAGLLALRLILLGVLRPLVAIERAAAAISARDFVTIDERPATRELARVVEAMNALSGKVRDAIATETARAASLQRAAYVDEVSGLLNRQGFVEAFENAYAEDREKFSGTFALIEIPDLAAINRELGAMRCDELLGAIGGAIGQSAGPMQGFAGRWAGAQFALALPARGAGSAAEALNSLHARLSLIIGEYGLGGRSTARVGGVAGELEHANLDAIVRAAQESLAGARELDGRSVVMRDIVHGASMEATADAGALVTAALSGGNVLLVGQRVLALPGGALLHTEIMARIPEGPERVMAAAKFMAVVSQLQLSRRLDEAVLARVRRSADDIASAQTVAVNLSARSLEHADFIDWLVRWVKALPAPLRVVFELSEHGVVHNESAASALASALSATGAGFAIDHFGVHRNSLALVPVLKPAYVKLSGLHTPKLASEAGTRFLVDSVVRAARQLDVPVIAQNVESEGQLAELQQLGVAGYQGYLAGAPAPWPGMQERDS